MPALGAPVHPRPLATACPRLRPGPCGSHPAPRAGPALPLLSWQAGLCARPCAARLASVGAPEVRRAAEAQPLLGRPWTRLPECPSPWRAPTSMPRFPPNSSAPLHRAQLSRHSVRDTGPCSPSPPDWRPGPGARPGTWGPWRSAGRQGARQPGRNGGRKSRPGRSRAEVTAEAELYLPRAVRSPPPPRPLLQPRACFHRRPAAVLHPGWQPGLVRPPAAPGRVLRLWDAGRRRPAAAGSGHGAHRGLGGVVPAGGLPAPAGLRHLPAAEAGARARTRAE